MFPGIRDYFKNVFSWNRDFALITGSSFLVISGNGELQARIKIPEDIKNNEEEDTGWAANRICVEGKYLYYVNIEGIIYKYKIK